MSILNVEHLSHGFGDRAIFHDVSFRLLKGEHIGLIGANGEGKSTFMNIITGRLQPDEGKVEWSKNVRAGYLDQHTALEKGMTIRQVLTSAFDFLLDMEQELNGIYEKMGEADEDTMQQLMEDAGTLQELLTAHDFYMIDSKVEEVGRASGFPKSVWTRMFPSCPAVSVLRYFWVSFCWRNRTSCFWTSPPTISMFLISNGSNGI